MEKLKIFFKKLLKVFKVVLSIIFLIYSGFIIYVMYIMPFNERFNVAEHSQGLYFSQKVFEILKSQNPNNSNVYFEQSVAFNKRGDYAKGFELLNKAVELDPKLHLGYRGWLKYNFLKDYKDCIKDLKRLDTLTPNFVDAPWGENIHYLLGLSYKGLKQYDLAFIEFDKNLKTEKDSSWVNPNMYLYKGIIYKNLKEYNKAILNLNACLKNNYDNSSEAYYYKGLVYKELGKIDSAKVFFNKSLNLYSQGYKNSDVYTEVQDELYLSDIEAEINKLKQRVPF